MLNINERASAIVALRPLEADPSFFHGAPVLRRSFSDEVLRAIKEAEAEAREFNKSMKEAGIALLSPDAAQYWSDCQRLIARGKAAQAAGNRAWEARVNRDSERLLETFDERVPDADKPKFKQLDPQRHKETWDDKWSYIEFPVPLLNEQFELSYSILNVRNHAQTTVLRSIAGADVTLSDAEKADADASALKLRRIAYEARQDKDAEQQAKDARANLRAYVASLTPDQKKDRRERLKATDKAMGITKAQAGPVYDEFWEGLPGKKASATTNGEDA